MTSLIQRGFKEVFDRLAMIEGRLARLEHRVDRIEDELHETREAIGLPARKPRG